ncbi:Bug family tripartite tricarboxylate transporter substrate binding protein [Pigmentiphaga kullae]|uniref:Tripartite-type tricarboxylate transporter receptor subunit TctC n=1 Tax=Pigmentiphaga kullae TaxID=151784 RepID=A0A4Q7NJR9_9BURK|nr:tripartite tricarboxylate transporter substrate binding protein [Pigmentiphaga kullae]RZS84750.1 tripartite-type tricarboxylate transporter receptor subunit TctC [Pigmentiphaga kullae]
MAYTLSRAFAPWLALAGILLAPAAVADTTAGYPERPVKLALPFPPGGSADTITRSMAERLQAQLHQPFLIENRPGAAGNVATRYIAKAPADGYNLLVGVTGAMAINPNLYTLDYDPARDFVAVSMVARAPVVVVADPQAGIGSIKQLIEQAKARPGMLTYATNGVGTSHHLAAELFRQAAGLDMRNVPYKGTPEALQDIIGGRVPLGFMDLTASIPLIASGKLKALATTGIKRTPALPDVPTVAEAGVPGFAADTWVGIFAPKGTPQPIVEKLSAEMKTALALPELRARAQTQGLEVAGSTPAELQRFLQEESAKWKRVVNEAGIKLQ